MGILLVGILVLAACAPSTQELENLVATEVAQVELPVGPQGEPGPQGEQGIQGESGEQGIQGRTGVTGRQGRQGGPGPTGAQGAVGPAGQQGIPGENAADFSQVVAAEIVRAELAAAPAASQPGGGVTAADAERIARGVVASIPPRSAPADYTAFVVDSAIALYETQGLEATLTHYSRKQSVDGQWYVFIIDEDDRIAAHPDPHRVGLDVKGWVGTDVNGYHFAPEMLSATDEGKWVSYVFANPDSGDFGPDHAGAMEYKHVWVARHDGLLFASGWYIPADEYTRFVVDEAIARYQAEGLEEILAYYSSLESVDGQWYVFVATPEGEIVGHYNADGLAVHVQEMLDDGSFGPPRTASG